MKSKDQALDVWGEFACFSRPEMGKVERFSYPVITPSAARGIYDAIYCKSTEFRWQITRIEILAPPNYIALRRNEVKEWANVNEIAKWMCGAKDPEPIWADGVESKEKGRTQRQTMALRDVRYRLHAEIRPWTGFESSLQGCENQFRRRAANGKCFHQPYFGCREFPAYFNLVQPGAPAIESVAMDMEIDPMLYDVFDLSRPGSSEDKQCISLFQAAVQGGVLDVPNYESDEVRKSVGGER